MEQLVTQSQQEATRVLGRRGTLVRIPWSPFSRESLRVLGAGWGGSLAGQGGTGRGKKRQGPWQGSHDQAVYSTPVTSYLDEQHPSPACLEPCHPSTVCSDTL